MKVTDIDRLLDRSRSAARDLNLRGADDIDALLRALADSIENSASEILEANSRDLARMDKANPKYDRLRLTADRLAGIAADMRAVAALPSPLGNILDEWTRPNGMTIRKVSVPFGVIGVVYEARPNVTFDVASLCLKAGSACVLKGGSDAQATNETAIAIIRDVLDRHGFSPDCATLLPAGHDATEAMLNAAGKIDVIIPRGGRGLIDFVRDNSRVPVIETGAGVCHTYLHASGRTDYARDIVLNAKTRRVSVCNSLDAFIIDRSRLADLRDICMPLADRKVEIHADTATYAALDGHYPYLTHAETDDYGREWMDYKMLTIAVDGIDQALDTIARYGSRHSEAIVADDDTIITRFLREVDAACVYANVSTAFTDGGQFGFGAEIGISTQKLHARGPMGLPEITTYKYLVTGSGQTRNS